MINNRLYRSIGLIVLLAISASPVFAQQTLEEATDSIRNVLELAKKGDAGAQNQVGGWYYRGRHVKQNYEEALQWWARSAKQGNVQAIGNMGLCYQTGNGIERDSLMAVQLYMRSIGDGNTALFDRNLDLAQKGNVFSCMLIADCYQKGIGVKKDPAKSLPFLTKAADANCAAAQLQLGIIYLNARQPAEAVKWLKKGALNGDGVCLFHYGRLLLEGQGIKQDKTEGINCLLRAADAGVPQSMVLLGDCYMDGNGVRKNPEQGLKWYAKGAGKGSATAEWKLADCYRLGIGTPVNYDLAMTRYAQAALTPGRKKAFKELITDSIPDSPFVAYLKGMKDYYAKNFDAALKQFRIVEKAKIADGKVMQAVILANSSYPKSNPKKAVKLLKECSEKSPQAMYLLSGLYETGKGVDKNMQEAVGYMKRAAEDGYGAAQCALGDMYFEGRGVEQDYALAAEWYGKAYNQGLLTENAAKRYASCYAEGLGGLEKDPKRADTILSGDFKTHISELLSLL